MKARKILTFLMSISFLTAMVAVSTGCSKKGGDADTFTIWMGSSVNSTIYENYGSNPVIQYMEKKFGIKMEFTSPIVGKETDDFNKLIASGEYPDMMDITYYTDSVSALYDDGYGAALDLTDLIAKHMPNYTKFMADNAELTKYAKIDGKYLTLNNYNEAIPKQWGGFMYRRDWLVKYDGNPDQPDADGNYKDGVHFPDGYLDEDGYDNPLTIADWEYMFSIFSQVPDCKYCITVPAKGYHETGELVSAFGVGGLWNIYEGDTAGVYDTVQFGGTTDNFRRYVETMAKWYSNGWLDPNFTSNSSDMFYALDGKNIVGGNVGMWYGTAGQLSNTLEDKSVSALVGIDVWGACQPKETVDSKDPTVFYQDGQETARRWIITKSAENKNIGKLLEALDWLYSIEGSTAKSVGLTKEQWNEYDIDKSLITRFGLEEGAYWYCDANGNKVDKGTEGAIIYQNPVIVNATGDINVGSNLSYFFGLGIDLTTKTYDQDDEVKSRAYKAWALYKNNGTVSDSLKGQMTTKESSAYNTIQEKIRETMGSQIPGLIKKGVTNSSWNSFIGQLKTRKCADNTASLQAVIDRLKSN